MKKLSRLLLVLLAVPALSGCLATLGLDGKTFENRLTMTTACDEVRTDSQWGMVGISSKVTARDAAPVLAALCGGKNAGSTPVPAAPAASAPK